MEYLKVKNWSKFQHYKTRNPPWIKLYRDITSDYGFNALSDVDKCHLMLIWCEAASHNGEVPHDAKYLRRRLSLKSNPDLNLFINNGWLIKMLAPVEKRREENKREEGSRAVFKEFPKGPTSTHEQVERNRAIAGALASENRDEAARIRGKA